MKVGILGSGDVAQSLAKGFVSNGHDVMVGSDHLEKLAPFKSTESAVQLGSFVDAAAFGELIVFSVKGVAAEVLAIRLAKELAGKTVIDTTNPIADAPPQKGVLKFFTDLNLSLHEILQKSLPTAHFVKAFNSVGAAAMVHPDFGGVKPTMFICGDNADAKKQVAEICEQFGWDVADMGGATAARAIEPLCMLWCIPGFVANDWYHAFKLLKK